MKIRGIVIPLRQHTIPALCSGGLIVVALFVLVLMKEGKQQCGEIPVFFIALLSPALGLLMCLVTVPVAVLCQWCVAKRLCTKWAPLWILLSSFGVGLIGIVALTQWKANMYGPFVVFLFWMLLLGIPVFLGCAVHWAALAFGQPLTEKVLQTVAFLLD